MIQEPDNRRRFFELRLEFRDQGHRLRIEVVQIEHQQGRRLSSLSDSRNRLLFALHEFNLHSQLLCRLLNLRLKEQVLDETENPRRSIRTHRNTRQTRVHVIVIAGVVSVS